jgi:hypothetical protein
MRGCICSVFPFFVCSHRIPKRFDMAAFVWTRERHDRKRINATNKALRFLFDLPQRSATMR